VADIVIAPAQSRFIRRACIIRRSRHAYARVAMYPGRIVGCPSLARPQSAAGLSPLVELAPKIMTVMKSGLYNGGVLYDARGRRVYRAKIKAAL